MSAPETQLGRFVRALSRRQVLLRLAEHAGLGLAAGCGVAVLLVPVLLWRGQGAWGPAGVALAVGTLAGAGYGVTRRPGALAAAAEADRQLGTADLLATAWALCQGRAGAAAADAWRGTVVALGAERVRGLSPSAVLLRRFGARAWGGIALAVALVGTLASFSPEGLGAVAARSGEVEPRTEARRDAPRPLVNLASEPAARARRQEQNPGDQSVRGSTAAEDAAAPESAAPDDPDGSNAANTSRQTAAGGKGEGSGRTEADPTRRNDAPPAAPSSERVDQPSPTGRPAGGSGGRARAGQAEPGEGAAGTVDVAEAGPGTRPWQHSSWRRSAEAAGDAIRAGRVPDDYHNLVREYFDRPSADPVGTRAGE